MLRPERYEGEHDDLRFEYSKPEYHEDEADELCQEAGCNDQCGDNCDCIRETFEAPQEPKDLERDFRESRGI